MGNVVEHRGQRNCKRKKSLQVPEKAACPDLKPETGPESDQDVERELKLALGSWRQQQEEILDILRHTLEELLIARVPLKQALVRRLKRHAPSVASLASNDYLTPLSVNCRNVANVRLPESTPIYSKSTSAMPSDYTRLTEYTPSEILCKDDARSDSSLSEVAAKRQRHDQSDCFDDAAPVLRFDATPDVSALQPEASPYPCTGGDETSTMLYDLPHTATWVCSQQQQQERRKHSPNSIKGEFPEFQYPPPKEIVPNSLWVAKFVSDSTPCNIRLGNAASYPPRDPNELFKEPHDPTVNATIDVQAEATGSFMPTPASGISQPTGSIFPLDDITPGEFDWSTWMNDDLEFEYLFDQDGQARPFAPSTPAPG